ncbi:MAG: DNA internalization-related competence protein ComEC/Rec2 [Bacilli bacterium]|nr:DNA internalization-related competence protein ComEC/Rec2 [Bacilli bacterium]MDD4808432.1 DNA internalization-related competence protein ComEC/Rec2 [Bacilli bacterium]
MKSSKIILLFSVLVSGYTWYIVKNNIYHTDYRVDSKKVTGYIDNIKKSDNKTTIILKNKEKILINYYEPISLESGDYIEVEGIFTKPSANSVFSLFNYRHYLLSQRIYWIIKEPKITKLKNNTSFFYQLKNKVINKIDSLGNPYIKTFILGDINEIDDEVITSYQLNGTIHIFSVSGTHITLLSFILLKLFNLISKKETINYLLVTIVLSFYLFLTSFSPPVTRSVLMFSLLTFKKQFKVNISTLDILILIGFLLLLINPYYVYHLGFKFSFIISFYLILFQKFIANYKNYFIQLFMVSLVAFLASIPLMINNFFYISLLTPIFNIFFVPLVSVIIFPLSLITFIFPFLLPLFNLSITILESLSLMCSKVTYLNIILKDVPMYIYFLYYLLITYVLYQMNKQKFRAILLVVIVIFIHTNLNYLNFNPTLTMIDVGQGDSLLITLSHNKGNIMIDTGGIQNFYGTNNYSIATATTIPYLKSSGIKKIDYLVLTHGDYDHMGEAINLVENFKTENVIFNCNEFNELEQSLIEVLDKKNIKYYSCIKELNIDKYKLQFLKTKEYYNENNNSNVIYFHYNNYKFLFMGDAGVDKEKDILEKCNLTDIDFLKVGHHGSNTSSSEEFINSVNPKYSLISVGKNNRYGHPKESVLDTLFNSKIYRTDQDGSIEIKLNENGYKIKTCSS